MNPQTVMYTLTTVAWAAAMLLCWRAWRHNRARQPTDFDLWQQELEQPPEHPAYGNLPKNLRHWT